MEKKGSPRAPSSSARGNNSESKGKQDNGTKYPRLPRFRDNACYRPEPSRRPLPQRNKSAHDKRPRQRGSSNFDRDRSEIVQSVQAEVGSPLSQGSKKQNLNHLLNFSFAPRTTGDSHTRFKTRKKWPKFSKEQFLQANCQFVVRENGDYSVHAGNPDILVGWELVEEIRLPSHEIPSCPICLYPPVAAKITRCGHIYCWPCILHYLSLSESAWSKCPICYEMVHKGDLKSVVSTTLKANLVGEMITMFLMKRGRGTVYSVPVTHWTEDIVWPFHLDDGASATCFQKLLASTSDQVKVIIDREKSELQHYLTEQQEPSELCFIQMCFELLSQRKDALLPVIPAEAETTDVLHFRKPGCLETNLGVTSVVTAQMEEPIGKPPFCSAINSETIHSRNYKNSVDLDDDCNSSEEAVKLGQQQGRITGERVFDPSLGADKEMEFNATCSASGSPAVKTAGKDFYYFYQASDGQLIFLHSLNARMLVKQYGSLESCPPTFTARILQLERISMTEELRVRLPYLRHLPLSCEFQVVEIDAAPPLISSSVAEAFTAETERRQKSRTRRSKAEFRREKHIEEEKNKKLGKFPTARYHLDSLQQFPLFTCEVPGDLTPFGMQHAIASNDSSDPSPMELNSDITSSGIGIATSHLTSFAQMLREGKAKPDSNKDVKIPQTQLAPDKNGTGNTKHSEGGESDMEDYVPAPEYHQSFMDAIQTALDGVTMKEESEGTKALEGNKKKKKKLLLFATGMNRSK